MNKKKKKPAFGYFCTLNPDAGDVEKNIERFNNSTSDDISSLEGFISNAGIAEEYITEKKEEKETSEEEIRKAFDDIIDEFFPSVSDIDREIEKLCSSHKGEEAWDKAFEKWQKNLDPLDESLNTLKEDLDLYDYIRPTTIEDMREGSIDNMEDSDIDFQERTFSHICKKLKTPDRDIIAIKYDDGYYDYNPDYIDDNSSNTTKVDDKYGSLYDMGGMVFFKEKKYPFLYFRSEDDLRDYIFKANAIYEG